MLEIVPDLWLGDENDAKRFDSRILGAVLNCTTEIPFHEESALLPRARLSVKDDGDPCQMVIMARELPEVVQWIDRVLSSQCGALLVHCRKGRQRSACVVAAYLMHKQGLTPGKAIEQVKAIKKDAFVPCPNFRSSLAVYAVWLHQQHRQHGLR